MLGSRIAIMNSGSVIEIGTGKELFLSPKTEFAARFLASGHVLPCKVTGKKQGGSEYVPAVYMLPDYMPMEYVPVKHTPPEYIIYEVSTPLGEMTVTAQNEPPAEIRQDRGSPPANGQDNLKLFIPHDAIHLEDSSAAAGRKTFSAVYQGSFYNGPNLIVKVLLPASEHSAEQLPMEIVASPRTNIPAPGSMVDLRVDERLLRFVRADH